MAENTLIVCTTDHGLPFPNMKCNLTDFGWGVSLIMRGPGPFRGGKVCDALVSQLDIYPTITEMLGLKRPDWLEGRSLLCILRGDVKEVNDEVFAEVNLHASYEPKRAVRTQRYKYIRRYDGRKTPVLPNSDDSPSKSLWLEYGWKQRPVPGEELFDLIFDPCESNNPVGDPASGAALREMRAPGCVDETHRRSATEGPASITLDSAVAAATGGLLLWRQPVAEKKLIIHWMMCGAVGTS